MNLCFRLAKRMEDPAGLCTQYALSNFEHSHLAGKITTFWHDKFVFQVDDILIECI